MLEHLNINLRIVTLWYGGHEENDNDDYDNEDNQPDPRDEKSGRYRRYVSAILFSWC